MAQAGVPYTEGDLGLVVLAVDENGNLSPLSLGSAGELETTAGEGGGGGSGTEYVQDAAAPANPTAGTIVAVRDDALSTITPAEGDWAVVRVNDSGALWVAHDGSIAVTDGGGSLTVDGTVAVSGTVPVSDAGGSLTVDGTVAVTGVSTAANQSTIIGHVDGIEGLLGTIDADTGIVAALSKAEDAAHTSGDPGIPLLAVRQDTLAASTSADNDYGILKVDDSGLLRVRVDGLVQLSALEDSITASLDASRLMDGNTAMAVGRVNAAPTADATLIAAQGANLEIQIHAVFASSAAAVTFQLDDGSGGTRLMGPFHCDALSGAVVPFSEIPWARGTANTLLHFNQTAGSGAVGLNIIYSVRDNS